MTTTTAISDSDFSYVRDLVLDRSAIVLEANKAYLAESRLISVARAQGMSSLAELVARLRSEQFGGLHTKVVEAMTTNETTFFRDSHPFEALRTTVLPELIERRGGTRSLQVWSAACSTGQEPYSLAMLLREHFPALRSWAVRILATDLSTEVLARASAGKFSQLEVNRGLPANYLVKYLQKQGVSWQVADDLRTMIDFRQMNLAATWPSVPMMDVVFIRNVLIYFDADMKRTILGKIRNVLRPDGYLFLGGAETTINLDDAFERVQLDKASCYRLRAR
jgi:chemotaxis protein methyltransferase CheR